MTLPAMRLDFSSIPLKHAAFSGRPMTFIDQEAKNFLSQVMDVVAIETGGREAREYWQKKQLQNVLGHAARRSPFWRKNIGTSDPKDVRLTDLPVQSRADVIAQVKAEGALVRHSEVPAQKHSTSGSTGMPVEFFVTARNGTYNLVRSAAQYFMDGSDLSLNRTRVRSKPVDAQKGFTLAREEFWFAPLKNFLKTGTKRVFNYFHPDMAALCDELAKEPLGYLAVHGRFIESIIRERGVDYFREAGTRLVIPVGEEIDAGVRGELAAIGIPSRSYYSAEEFGPIASECASLPGSYHVVTSNVIVEVERESAAEVGGAQLGRVLVTGLHAYATPFIRYDIGDLARLEDSCACGHDGPVLRDIHGREKEFLKHADGRLTIFHTRAKEFLEIADIAEYRIRQVVLDRIVVEVAARKPLSEEQTLSLEALVRKHSGPGFAIEVKPVSQIDWGRATKRLGFKCEV